MRSTPPPPIMTKPVFDDIRFACETLSSIEFCEHCMQSKESIKKMLNDTRQVGEAIGRLQKYLAYQKTMEAA